MGIADKMDGYPRGLKSIYMVKGMAGHGNFLKSQHPPAGFPSLLNRQIDGQSEIPFRGCTYIGFSNQPPSPLFFFKVGALRE